MKLFSLKETFPDLICKKLIIIETGIRIFNELRKSFSSIKNSGVPNNNNPTPKID